MIIALTPNLTLDRVLSLDRPLVAGQLHRVPHLTVAAGGKGVNLARAVRALGGDVTVAGVVGGFNGQKFEQLMLQEGLTGVLEHGEGETRECHILLGEAGQHPTELYEAGPTFQPSAVQRLVARLTEAPLSAGLVAVCGSLAPGTSKAAFTTFLGQLRRPVVDSSGVGLQAALDARVALIKPNEHELEGLIGNASLQATRDLYRRTGVAVLLTLGQRGAAYVGQEIWQATAPTIEARNPVGSGDSLLGAFLQARQAGQSIQEALRLGVAAGSANAMLGGPLNLRAEVIHQLLPQVHLSTPI